MVVIEDLKLNTTQQVSIPKPSELFKRFGFNQKAGNFSGDEYVNVHLNKVEAVQAVEKEVIDNE